MDGREDGHLLAEIFSTERAKAKMKRIVDVHFIYLFFSDNNNQYIIKITCKTEFKKQLFPGFDRPYIY